MREKILVIDQIGSIPFVILVILSREGYDVSTAYDYMSKPVEENDLLHRVRMALSNRAIHEVLV